MAKAFELAFKIGGQLAQSFTSSFSNASNRLSDLNQEARRTQREIDRLGNDFRQGRIHQTQYAEATGRLTREMRQLEASQRRVSAIQGTLSKGFSTAKMVTGMAAVGTVAVATGVALDSLNKAATFEQQMTKVGVISGSSAGEMKKLSAAALQLGADTSLSASEVADGMNELATKGYSATNILSAMPGMIAAAESSGEDLALTSNVVASALNAFNLEGTESSRVADIMAMTANKTAAGVEDLGYSFKYAAPWANSLEISMEELAAATGSMVDKGLAGEQAGTALRMGLSRLAQEPKKAEKALKKLGVTAFDQEGNFTSLNQLIDDLRDSTKELSKQDKIKSIGAIFGVEAASGWLTLIDSAPDKLDKLTESLEKSEGAAQKAADAMKDNYGGALEQLQGSFESAQIAFATPILPVFQDLFNGLGAAMDSNMGGVEKAGEKTAAALRDILDPFSTTEPVKPVLMDVGSISNYNVLMEDYRQNLEKYNKFSGMDFGDKFVYMLDTATAKMESWLSGSGGESMGKIFTKLGEIAAASWYAAFTTAVKSSGSNLAQGNILPAVGLGAAAWMLGGGAMVKSAVGAGRWAVGKAAGRNSGGPPPTGGPPPIVGGGPAPIGPTPANSRVARRNAAGNNPPSNNTRSTRSTRTTPAADVSTRAARNGAANAGSTGLKGVLGKSAKFLGKAALPLTLASSALAIFSSHDKKKTAVEEGAGIGGALGGAKLGATIGTFIAPGIGTAIGGALGGLAGYIGGKWLGGKAVDKARGNDSAVAQSTSATSSSGSTTNNTALNTSTNNLKSAMDLSANNFRLLGMYAGDASGKVVGAYMGIQTSSALVKNNLDILTSYTGQASGWIVGSFMGIQSSADMVRNNLELLTSYAGQASGWLVSLNRIQTAGDGVVEALNNLKSRINNTQVPGVSKKRVSFDG